MKAWCSTTGANRIVAAVAHHRRALSGAKCEGRLHLPGGSENRVFVRRNKAVVILWNDAPTTKPCSWATAFAIRMRGAENS